METVQNAASLRCTIILSKPFRINLLFHWNEHEILTEQGVYLLYS